MSILKEKKNLRQELRRKRSILSQICQKNTANHIIQLIKAHNLLNAASHIALYLPTDGEVDPQPIIQEATRLNIQCYLPCLNDQNKMLTFYPYQPNDTLTPNQYHILEPNKEKPKREPTQLDLLILPLVAFDLDGNRLGRGAGYYDITLSFKTAEIKKPLLIGLAYEFQKVKKLPADKWDIQLDMIITEKQIYHCNNEVKSPI